MNLKSKNTVGEGTTSGTDINTKEQTNNHVSKKNRDFFKEEQNSGFSRFWPCCLQLIRDILYLNLIIPD